MIRSLVVASLAAAVALTACSPAEPAPAEPTAPTAGAVTPTPAMAAYTSESNAYWTGGRPVTPADVAAMIQADGAQPTVMALGVTENTRWTTMMAGVASGEPEWLALVKPLEPGTENSTAYDLNAALKAALVVNPAGVLALLDSADPDLSVESVCTMDAIEIQPAQYAAYYDALTPAVQSVTDPALADKKAACMSILTARAGA